MELIIGAGVSLIIQFIKTQLKLSEYWTLFALFVLAVVAAAVYQVFVHTGLWEIVRETLVYAGAFYAFIIQRFAPGSTLSKAFGNG